MSKRLGWIKGCKYKISSWHLLLLLLFYNNNNNNYLFICLFLGGERRRCGSLCGKSFCLLNKSDFASRPYVPLDQIPEYCRQFFHLSFCMKALNITATIHHSSLYYLKHKQLLRFTIVHSGCGKERCILIGPW